jgi:hypothetical protein
METLLNYGPEAAKSQLETQGWKRDTAGHLDATSDSNLGYKSRKDWVKGSRIHTVKGLPHCDIFHQKNFIPNGVDIQLALLLNRPQFMLMRDATDTENYRIELTRVIWRVRRVEPSPTKAKLLKDSFESGVAVYPIQRGLTRKITISPNVHSEVLQNIFMGPLPHMMVIALTTNAASNGDYAQNPYNCQNFDVNSLSVNAGGVDYPSQPFEPNYSSVVANWVREYTALFEGQNIYGLDQGLDISLTEYSQGYTLYLIDLNADAGPREDFITPQENGNVRLALRFGTPPTVALTAVIFAVFDNRIHVDRNKNIHMNWP